MTGRFRELIRPNALIRLAAFSLLAFLTLLVSSDSVRAAGSFNPVNTSTYCADGTGDIDDQQLTVSCTPDASPGSHPDIVSSFDIGLGPDGQAGTADDTGDYNFGGVVALSPTVPDDNAIPVGAILGRLGSQPTLGLVNNTCSNSQLRVPFTFMKGTTDITDTVEPQPFGSDNELAIMAGDNPPFSGQQDVKPPPAVTKYPSFLNAIFDPDWVDFGPDKIAGNGDDNNGPAPPIKPVFRAVGTTAIGSAGNLWIILQLVVFDKGVKLPNFPALDPGYGYPSVVVLQTASASGSATPPAPSAVTDFCSPLKTVNVSYGVTKDNPDTPANEGGIPVRTLPEAGPGDCDLSPPGPACIVGFSYGSSQRDADGDGYENSLDTCPFNSDAGIYNPRDTTPPSQGIPGDSDKFVGQNSPDGISDVCDPTPTEATAGSPANQPTDHDGDGFPNKGDNCPLVSNGVAEDNQKDSDLNAAGEEIGDGIGDACDPNPGTPDGAEIVCIKVSRIAVGGDGNVGFSACLPELPPLGSLPPPVDGGGGADGGASGPGGSTTGGAGGTGAGGGAAGGAGGPASGIGSLSPVAGTVPAWAAIAAGLGTAGLIGSLGTLAARLVNRRRDD